MAVNDVAIGRIALQKLGESAPFNDFNEDTKVARELTKCYALLRNAELRRRKWRFSLARASLPEALPAPSFGYSHAYNLPSDCLRALAIGDYAPGSLYSSLNTGLDTAEYSIEGRQVLTDQGAPLKIRYIREVTDEAQFDSAFVQAFAARIAYECADVIAPGRGRKADAMTDYRIAISEAIRANAIESPKEEFNDDSWLQSRQGG